MSDILSDCLLATSYIAKSALKFNMDKENCQKLREAMKTACEDGDFHKVFDFIKDGHNPKHSLPGSQKPLHYAANHGNLDVVRMLVEVHGCNPQCADKYGCTPLHYACCGVPEAKTAGNMCSFCWSKEPSSGHFEVAKFLLSCSVTHRMKFRKHSTKSRMRGNAAPLVLHLACRYGTAEFVKFLIEEHNCCLSTTNMNKDTAVHVASKYGHVEILKYLSEEKLCSIMLLNKDGNTPLHLACKYQHFGAVKYLVSKRLNLTMVVNRAQELPTHLACMQGSLEIVKLVTTSSNILVKAHNGATPLHVASLHGSLEVVKFLIEEMHCEPSIEDENHLTVLDYACGHNTIIKFYYYGKESVKDRNIQVAEYLALSGCDPMRIRGGVSPMQIACNDQADSLGLVKALTIKRVNCRSRDSDGNTPLHLACRANKMEIVRFLALERHCSQEIQNKAGQLPLHIACRQQSLELVKLVSNCDVNVLTNDGDTPTHIACRHYRIDAVAYLTQERHCDLNIPNTDGELPLHIACEKESLEMVKLVSNCNLHVQTGSRFTPLHIACKRAAMEVVEYLVQEKQCVPSQYPHLYDDLLIHCACAKGSVELVRKLVNSANANMRYQSTEDEYGNSISAHGNTPLHEACRSANVEVVRFLVKELHCDQGVLNQKGELPLHLACRQRSLEIVKLVSNCDVNCQTKYREETPLHIACREEALDVVRYLTQMRHCDITLANGTNEVPLHIACSKQSLEMVQLVSSPLVHIVEVNHGDTPLHIACMYGRTDFVRYLTENYVFDPTIQNRSNKLPLHYACQHSLEMTELVSNCDVDCRASDGVTPLHIACEYRKLDIVRYLIEKKNCNPDVEDSNGLTVLNYTCGYSRGCIKLYFEPADVLDEIMQEQATVVKYLMTKCDYDPASVLSLYEIACKEGKIELAKSFTTNADLVNSSDAEGNTPLHIACMNKQLEIVKFLTEDRKCNQRIKNQARRLPLHIACESDSPLEMVKLVSTDCDTNAQTNFGNTALHIACKRNETSFKTLEFLTKQCHCDQTIQNVNGELPLHIVCGKNSLEVVKLVSNCDSNTQTKLGNTALHIACKRNETSFKTLEFLTKQCHCDQTIQNVNGELPLHIVCSKNSLEVVKLVSNCDSNTQTKLGNTPLHIACKHNEIEVIQFLTDQCLCDQTIPNNDGELPLHIACGQQPLEVVKLVMKCDSNAQTNVGSSPLHIACERNKINIIQILTQQYRCDQTIRDKNGELPLHIACRQKSIEVVKLVSSNCDVNVRTTEEDTALHIVCRKPEQIDIADFLVNSRGADPSLMDGSSRSPIHTACMSGNLALVKILVASTTVNLRDSYGNTPLHIACGHGDKHLKIANFLTTEAPIPTDLSIQNNCGNLPLHTACQTRSIALVKLVSKCNPDVKNDSGDTPIHIACGIGDTDIVRYLLKTLSCDPKIQNQNGELPLHVACSVKSLRIVKYLRNCDPNMQTASGDTPLHTACRPHKYYNNETESVVQFLITEMKCDYAIQNKKGELPLHLACKQSLELVQLVSHCNVNTQREDGNTPLHIACMRGKKDIIKYLTETKQCDKNIRNNKGELPLHIACAGNNLEMAMLVCECNTVNAVTTTGDTPLHLALQPSDSYPPYVDSDLLRFLISKGCCDITVQNNNLELPLHIACENHPLEVVTLVDECDVNARTKSGDTPLHIACGRNPICDKPAAERERLEIVERLVKERHSDLTIQNKNKELPLHIACFNYCSLDVVKLVSDCNVSIQTVSGDTPLHYACRSGIVDVVGYLIKVKRCSPNIPNNDNELPLHIACRSYNYNSNLEILKLLCECNVNTQTVQSGDTPLHYACRCLGITAVKYLVQEKSCDPTIQNRDGKLPLHLACSGSTGKDSLVLVELLTNNDADVNCKTLTGDTPLHEACKIDRYSTWLNMVLYGQVHTQVVQFLVGRKHCDPNVQNSAGMTPLHYACKLNADEIIEYLLSTGKVGPSIVAKDSEGNTPIMLTEDFEIIRELLNQGADPHPLYQRYQRFFKECSSETPPPTPLKVLVLGNASTGKTTLIESLKAEGKMVVQDSDPNAHTAGIIPNQFKSKEYGPVTFYDFAGQHEYYAGHEAVIRTIIRNTPPVILLLVNVSESEDEIKKKILYWLSFSDNQFSTVTGKPHFMIVGSHADVVTDCGGDPQKKVESIIESLKIHIEKSTVDFIAFITMDCRVSESLGIGDLRCHLRKSSKLLRDYGVMNFRSHCFHVYLLAHYHDLPAVSLNQVTNVLIQNHKPDYYKYQRTTVENSNPKGLLPTKPSEVDSICEELSERGHIVFLKSSRRRLSWVILNKETLFGEVNGTFFAPVGFKQHVVLASSTGVVPFSAIASHFPKHDPNMIVGFLSHLEFCHVITDEEVMRFVGGRPECPASSSASSELYFFFPHLISIESPRDVWKPIDKFDYQCGWLLWCSEGHLFFTSRFLQVVLLRLAFTFALKLQIRNHGDQPAIQCRCSIWKNGISWSNEDGIQTLVEVRDQGQAVVIMMRCIGGTGAKIECVSLRSSIIKKIMEAKKEFCPKLSTTESFIDPQELQYPPGPPQVLTLFSLSAVAWSVMKAKPCVICDGGMHHPPSKLEGELLHFEPYADFGEVILKKLFNEEKRDAYLTDDFLYDIADMVASKAASIDHKKDCFVRIFDPPRTMLQERIRQAPEGETHELVRIFKLWRDRSTDQTYRGLRQKLDEYSVFCGRNPLVRVE